MSKLNKSNEQQVTSIGEAPPPYTAPGPSSLPHQTTLPPSQVEAGVSTMVGWSPPPNEAVARARAQRRFWVAMLWAFGIWILVGLLLGGGISDIEQNPPSRHGHWDKHGQWHND